MARLRASWPWLGVLARLVVGVVWVVAGVAKVSNLEASVRAVRNFKILPEAVVPFTGYLLPMLEVTVGALLVIGFATRLVAVASSLLQLAFVIGIASVWARGLRIDCGCFGGGGATSGDATTGYALDLVRDSGLLVLSVLLVLWPTTQWALDSLIWRAEDIADGE